VAFTPRILDQTVANCTQACNLPAFDLAGRLSSARPDPEVNRRKDRGPAEPQRLSSRPDFLQVPAVPLSHGVRRGVDWGL
jgi:hypothetical protein